MLKASEKLRECADAHEEIISEIENFNWDADFDDEGNRIDPLYNEYAVYKIKKWQKLLCLKD